MAKKKIKRKPKPPRIRRNEPTIPLYLRRLPFNENVLAKGIKNILRGFNINHLSDEDCIKIFYSIIGNLVMHLEMYPTHYFQTDLVDITKDKDTLLTMRPNSHYHGTLDAQTIFRRYTNEELDRKELEKMLDVFAKSFLEEDTEVQEKIVSLEETVQELLKLQNEHAMLQKGIMTLKTFQALKQNELLATFMAVKEDKDGLIKVRLMPNYIDYTENAADELFERACKTYPEIFNRDYFLEDLDK